LRRKKKNEENDIFAFDGRNPPPFDAMDGPAQDGHWVFCPAVHADDSVHCRGTMTAEQLETCKAAMQAPVVVGNDDSAEHGIPLVRRERNGKKAEGAVIEAAWGGAGEGLGVSFRG
jgi:hypothetical protein